MQVFYAPDIEGDSYTLDESESRHIIRVLRMRRGSEIRLIDGRGNLYEGIVAEPDQKASVISINRVYRGFEKRKYKLHIAISPLKNPERFEWFVEKSVEIGIDAITPLICHNTEKKDIKPGRISNIIISAMKQSLKANLTVLNDPSSFSDFISGVKSGSRMIAHCQHGSARKSISEVYKAGSDAVILIGPEGDFIESEVAEAASMGFIPVHLGSSRLRTETAGIAACHSVYFLNQ